MPKPSIKSLEQAFPGKGAILRKLLTDNQAARNHPAAVALAADCFYPPHLCALRLAALNAEAETFGIEAVWRNNQSAYLDAPAFEYLNTGDMYAATIVRFASGSYYVRAVGDIIERGNYC